MRVRVRLEYGRNRVGSERVPIRPVSSSQDASGSSAINSPRFMEKKTL